MGRPRSMTDAQVRAAAVLYGQGTGLRELGIRYGVSPNTVSQTFKRAGVKLRPRGYTPKPKARSKPRPKSAKPSVPVIRKTPAPWTGDLAALMAGAPAPTLSVERFNRTPNSREWVPGRASEGAV